MSLKNLSSLSVLYILAWCISPPLASGRLYRIIAVIALMIVVVSSLSTVRQSQIGRLFGAVLLSAYIVLVAFVSHESYAPRIGIVILLLTSVSFQIWIDSRNTSSQLLWIAILWIIILFTIWNTTTIRSVLEHPDVMRKLVSSEKSRPLNYSVWGVGGYGYMYSAILMLPIGIDILFNKRRKSTLLVRIFTLYFVVTTVVLSYLSQYFMALIIAVIAVILSLSRRRNSSKVRISSYVMIFAIMILIVAFLEPILDFLINVIDIRSIHEKLVDMRAIMINGEDIGDSEFATRYERYTRDLLLIAKEPLFGTMSYLSVGKHSTFLDLIAQYGVIMGGLIITLLFRPCVDGMRRSAPISFDILALFLIIGLFNVLTLQVAAPLCFALPAYSLLLWERH